MNVARPDDGDFPEDEVRLLEQIGQQLAIAIENARHFDRAERYRREAAAQRDRLRLLLDVNNAVVGDLDPHELRTHPKFRELTTRMNLPIVLDAGGEPLRSSPVVA